MYHSSDGASVYEIQLDAPPVSARDPDGGGRIVFPDDDMLFTADFKRSGTDLILVGQNNRAAIVYGYFGDDSRASLARADGADLSGGAVEALAGSDNPGEYAQAANIATTRQSIGRVEKVSGSATVLRNGVPIELHLGDAVVKGDVVQTGSDSSLTIKFSDGTVFALSSSARIVLNEMVYAADSHENSALFTLVQGVIGFVAGRVAKTGDLKVETPVATMAIRGTAVQAEISAFSGTTKFSLLTEPDGRVGSFLILDKHNLSRVITDITDASVATIIAPVSASEIRVTQVSKSANDILSEGEFVRSIFQIFSFEPGQRKGSGDIDGIPAILPANAPPFVIDPDQRPGVTPFLAMPAIVQDFVFTNPVRSPAAVRGTATEDGPSVGIDALAGAFFQTPGSRPATVNVPASLPPGVTFREDFHIFKLDPSHPAYQHLAAGETANVTVNYSITEFRVQTPTSVSWIVTGRNDAPVARNDSFAGVDERAKSVLSTRANDSDVDGDSFHIVRWTKPLEGSIFENSSGNLVFDPGADFQALSQGETATVSFTYVVSDDKGGTDTASVTVRVDGTGIFSSPHIAAEASGVLVFNDQPVSLKIDAPSQTTTATAGLRIAVDLGQVPQPQMNILYVLDISESTMGGFAGAAIGDLNRDGSADTILDAEIAGLMGLTEQIRGLGFSPGDITVTVIPFNGSANPADETNGSQVQENTDAITFSLGSTEDETIANFLRSLNAGGSTNFEDALRAVVEKLQPLDQGGEHNLVYLLSDGRGTGSFVDELSLLDSVHQAKITALGMGQNADLSLLDVIDNTGGAEIVTSMDQLDAILLPSRIPGGKIIDLDVFVNGKEMLDIGPEDLMVTAGGLALDFSIAGLARQVGDWNTVSASIVFAGGETFTTELKIAGALPLSTDLIV